MTLSDVLGSAAVRNDTPVTVQMAITAAAGDMKADEGRIAELLASGVWDRQVEKYDWTAKNGLTVKLR